VIPAKATSTPILAQTPQKLSRELSQTPSPVGTTMKEKLRASKFKTKKEKINKL